jgi:hypothetical protein
LLGSWVAISSEILKELCNIQTLAKDDSALHFEYILRDHGRVGFESPKKSFLVCFISLFLVDLGLACKFGSSWWGRVFVCHFSKGLASARWGSHLSLLSHWSIMHLQVSMWVSRVNGRSKIATFAKFNMWTRNLGDIGEVADQ